MNAPETLQASAAHGHADTFARHFEEADACVSQAGAIANLLVNDPDNQHTNAAWAMRDLLDRAGAAINAMQRKHSAMEPAPVVSAKSGSMAETEAAAMVPWTLAWIQALDRMREDAVAQQGEQHAG